MHTEMRNKNQTNMKKTKEVRSGSHITEGMIIGFNSEVDQICTKVISERPILMKDVYGFVTLCEYEEKPHTQTPFGGLILKNC